jgi:hypothetical protein
VEIGFLHVPVDVINAVRRPSYCVSSTRCNSSVVIISSISVVIIISSCSSSSSKVFLINAFIPIQVE